MKKIILIALLILIFLINGCIKQQETATTSEKKVLESTKSESSNLSGIIKSPQNFGIFDYCENQDIKKWIALWKEFVLITQDISDDYFNDYISIKACDTAAEGRGGKGRVFRIAYDINIDWVNISSCQYILIKRNKNDAEYLTKVEIYYIPDYLGGLKSKTSVGSLPCQSMKLREISKIINQNEVLPGIKKCDSTMNWYLRVPILDSLGRLTIGADGITSDHEKCKHASLDLESGKLLECIEIGCIVY